MGPAPTLPVQMTDGPLDRQFGSNNPAEPQTPESGVCGKYRPKVRCCQERISLLRLGPIDHLIGLPKSAATDSSDCSDSQSPLLISIGVSP